MDPNTCLKRILELQSHLREYYLDADDPELAICDGDSTFIDMMDEYVSCVEDMHQWLSMGGFLPGAWDSVRTQNKLPEGT